MKGDIKNKKKDIWLLSTLEYSNLWIHFFLCVHRSHSEKYVKINYIITCVCGGGTDREGEGEEIMMGRVRENVYKIIKSE